MKEVSIFSVTTQDSEGKPVVKRFSTLEKAIEYVSTLVTTPQGVAFISNESCVLD